ncbi:MAG TPA: TlyA family RNA methyltransferase [Desulfobacterales bacterium]|nr:TlyA family RNA methyltransferase [Desulfobacterales bacterium]HIP39109.1 TlyA family RNA methyltransferase [Desulfocapsa sulfexigens]
MKKKRLDELLLYSGLCRTLQQAQALIGAGDITVDGLLADKAGTLFPETALPALKNRCPYVSRGGYKLKGGLDSFSFDPGGLVCLDIGASSGGFTDCLLQHGAEKVYAVDVAYGQLAWKLRQDKRVIVIERFNARKISKEQIPEPIDLAVIDAAFISLTKLIPPLIPLFGEQLAIIALIKPQFELPRDLVPKGGVVKDPRHHQIAIDKITTFAGQSGLSCRDVVPSPILGPKGNREFLLFLGR